MAIITNTATFRPSTLTYRQRHFSTINIDVSQVNLPQEVAVARVFQSNSDVPMTVKSVILHNKSQACQGNIFQMPVCRPIAIKRSQLKPSTNHTSRARLLHVTN